MKSLFYIIPFALGVALVTLGTHYETQGPVWLGVFCTIWALAAFVMTIFDEKRYHSGIEWKQPLSNQREEDHDRSLRSLPHD